jgi:hypothetical protein
MISLRTFVAAAVAAAGAAAIVAGVVLSGSPSEARRRRLDDRRIHDLRQISAAVDLHWTRTGRLPGRLADLPVHDGSEPSFRDPVTAQAYEYRTTGGATYELCAEFERPMAPSAGSGPAAFWAHGAGRHCFTLEARAVRR